MSIVSRAWIAGRRVADEMLSAAPGAVGKLRDHEQAAIAWLCRAQDANRDGGVSAGFHLKDGWLPSYPETTGYIACTLFDLAERLDRPELAERAGRMIDWLLTCQLDDGAFPGQFGQRSCGPTVFNTGQILFGLVRGAETDASRNDVRRAAGRAADWLVANMDADGCWRRHTHAGIAHTYNARTAWALLRAGGLLDEPRLREAAARNLRWALGRQRPDGWIEETWFRQGVPPFLHTIAYTIRGLLEGGRLLGEMELVRAAQAPAETLAQLFVAHGALAGAYDRGWQPAGRYRCLTGEAQMAIIWGELFASTREPLFRKACDRAVRFVASTQRLRGSAGVRGGVAGSYPIWGAYSRFEFPSWAAKFFVDAVAAREHIFAGASDRQPEAACV